MKKIILSFLIGNLSLNAMAELQPISYGEDNRVQFYDYNANQVFVVNTQAGLSTLIQLEPDEVIEGNNTGLGMGDAEAWSLAVKGNNIFLKPAQALPDTNMVIVTNKRSYAFQLTTSAPSRVSYIVRFNYPKKPTNERVIKAQPSTLLQVGFDDFGQKLLISEHINLQYYKKGDDTIMPDNAWDDGKFTYLRYPNAKELPVAYVLHDNGNEQLTNVHIFDETMVIHGVYKTLRLRAGQDVGDIANARYQKGTKFNYSGVSNPVEGTRINKAKEGQE